MNCVENLKQWTGLNIVELTMIVGAVSDDSEAILHFAALKIRAMTPIFCGVLAMLLIDKNGL